MLVNELATCETNIQILPRPPPVFFFFFYLQYEAYDKFIKRQVRYSISLHTFTLGIHCLPLSLDTHLHPRTEKSDEMVGLRSFCKL